MNKIFRIRFFDSHSDNRKFKSGPADQKRPRGRKWAGLFALVIAFTLCGAAAQAKQIGLTIPPNVLVRADRVIR